jgi:protein involved in polysaccharide export with SLBB domain
MKSGGSKFLIVAVCCAAVAVFAEAPVPAPEQVDEPVKQGSYVLGPGDDVEIRFFFNPELNERAVIRPDGYISMLMVGEVTAAGATPADLAARLTELYRDQITQPVVSVQVRGFNDRKIFVGGEVGRPGMLPMPGAKTAMEALLEAGGPLRDSAKRNELIVIRRSPAGTPVTMRVALNPKGSQPPEAATFQLQPLDVVLVAESGISKTNRAIDQYVRRNIPVLLTGGFNYLWGPAAPGFPVR